MAAWMKAVERSIDRFFADSSERSRTCAPALVLERVVDAGRRDVFLFLASGHVLT